MSARVWVPVLLVLLVGALGALFFVQNSARTTQLSFDLGFAAWQLSAPIAVTTVVGVAFGVGLLFGAALLLPGSMRLRRKVRSLEQQVAIGGVGERSEWR